MTNAQPAATASLLHMLNDTSIQLPNDSIMRIVNRNGVLVSSADTDRVRQAVGVERSIADEEKKKKMNKDASFLRA